MFSRGSLRSLAASCSRASRQTVHTRGLPKRHFSSANGSRNWVPAYVSMGVGTAVLGTSVLYYIKEGPAVAESKQEEAMKVPAADPTMYNKMEDLIRRKQKEIIARLEEIDGGGKFFRDEWTREDGRGGGITAVIEDGNVIEKGGCNISIISGNLPPAAVKKMRADHASMYNVAEGQSLKFRVCGLSMIMHPKNPMAPTVHLNYRYFETEDQDGKPQAWWFGGGADLTPYYLFEEDSVQFHRDLKDASDATVPEYYPKFRKWCDKYFYNAHRKEERGIGGIFFDDLSDRDPNQIFEYVEQSFNAFLKSYPDILNRRKDLPFTEKQKEWQLIRRGRYVEFNLVHDRGTAFGLATPGARIESILVSLPLHVSWRYNYQPPGPEEQKLIDVLTNPRDWLNVEGKDDE